MWRNGVQVGEGPPNLEMQVQMEVKSRQEVQSR